MKKFLFTLLFLIPLLGSSQSALMEENKDFPDGLHVVEFNASFNKSNEVTWLSKLSDCKTERIDIAADARWSSEYKIVVVPTLVILSWKHFNNLNYITYEKVFYFPPIFISFFILFTRLY